MKFLDHRRASSSNYTSITCLALGLLMVMLLSACSSETPDPSFITPSPTLTLTPTFAPTRTPTPLPPGSAENPFVIGIVADGEDPQVVVALEELPLQVADRTGLAVTAKTYPTYQQLLEDMERADVHIAWFPPLTYLYASGRGVAEAALLTNQFGVYQYGTQFLANAASGIQPYFDPISGQNSTDAPSALAQLAGKRPCWVEPVSAAGYIVPAGLQITNQIEMLPAVFTQSHTAVVRALYVQGICDYGATFSISGDPRTGSAVMNDLPDVMNRVLIIWRTDAIIPNVNLSYLAGLSEGSRLALNRAFLDIGSTPEGRGLLTVSAGNYEIEGLQEINDDLYNPLRDMVGAVRINLLETIGR